LPRTRNDAHRLIEECMLTANVCAADFLERFKHPALYRFTRVRAKRSSRICASS
jgi:exoribonuclease R